MRCIFNIRWGVFFGGGETYINKGVARGKGVESPPPETEKNCGRKMVLFPKALFLFLLTNFRKNKNKK